MTRTCLVNYSTQGCVIMIKDMPDFDGRKTLQILAEITRLLTKCVNDNNHKTWECFYVRRSSIIIIPSARRGIYEAFIRVLGLRLSTGWGQISAAPLLVSIMSDFLCVGPDKHSHSCTTPKLKRSGVGSKKFSSRWIYVHPKTSNHLSE